MKEDCVLVSYVSVVWACLERLPHCVCVIWYSDAADCRVYVCVGSDSKSSQSTLTTVMQDFLQIDKIFNFFKKLMSPVSFTALFLSYGTAFPIEPPLVVFFFSVQILLIPWVRWGMLTYAVCHAGVYIFKDNPTLNGIFKPSCGKSGLHKVIFIN